MKYNIIQMDIESAKEISKWIYEEPYFIYSMEESDEDIDELLNGFYFAVRDEANNLLGYYCFKESAQVPVGKQFGVYNDKDFTDIGLGIKPSLCGQGLGTNFLNHGLTFALKELAAVKFRLTVAAFNERAIKVYERIGFRKVDSFVRVSLDGEMEFWVMILN